MSELENVYASEHKTCLEIRPRERQPGTFSSFDVLLLHVAVLDYEIGQGADVG